jgi:hypothetical protein
MANPKNRPPDFVRRMMGGEGGHSCLGPDGSVAAESRDDSSCTYRYNVLLEKAQASLVNGDRGAAINSLIAAKLQLRTC